MLPINNATNYILLFNKRNLNPQCLKCIARGFSITLWLSVSSINIPTTDPPVTLYLLTLLDALKVIQCITLVSFFSEIFIDSFSGWNLHFFTVEGSHLKTLQLNASQHTKIKQNQLSFNNPEDIHDIPITYNNLYMTLRRELSEIWRNCKSHYNFQEILEMKKTYYENHRTGEWSRILMPLPHPLWCLWLTHFF